MLSTQTPEQLFAIDLHISEGSYIARHINRVFIEFELTTTICYPEGYMAYILESSSLTSPLKFPTLF
jgi:hypothetical protein